MTWGEELMYCSLSVAVFAEIDGLRDLDEQCRLSMLAAFAWPEPRARRGEDDRERYAELAKLPEYALAHMDDMLYGGRGCAAGFTVVARALAILAYQPGGVTFGPLRWCAAHMHERWTVADGVICPHCLREEIAAKTTPRSPDGRGPALKADAGRVRVTPGGP
jgi:hypothetical protein